MKRSLRWLGPLFAVALFGLAVFILHRTLGGRSWRDVVDALADLPRDRLVLAALLVVAAYLVLTLFDTMALHRVGTPLRWRSLAQVSFMAYAFGFNLGMPVLSGGAIRYRFYAAAGLTGLDVSRVLAFCVCTSWTGYLLVAGPVFLLARFPLPEDLDVAVGVLRLVGVAMLAGAAGWLVLAARRRRPLRVRGWEVPLPGPRLAWLQMGVAAAEWMVTAAIIHAVLPASASITYLEVLGIYLLAAVAGLLSHVPGGLGVLETVFVLSLEPVLPAHEVLGSVLAFRLLYFIAPLVIAAVMLAVHELRVRRRPKTA